MDRDPPFYRIVGVADDVRGQGLEKPPVEAVFFPIMQLADAPLWQPPNDIDVIVRTSLDDPTSVVPAIRQIIAAIDPALSVDRVQTMTSVVEHSLARVSFILRCSRSPRAWRSC